MENLINGKIPFVFNGLEVQEAPKKHSKEAAGLDLFSTLEYPLVINPGDTKKITTGLSVAIPNGYVGLVFARSSLGFKFQCTLTNGVGVIDSDYRGDIGVSITNLGKETKIVEPGERVAQLVILPLANFDYVQVEKLDETDRGTNGFGSTGTI